MKSLFCRWFLAQELAITALALAAVAGPAQAQTTASAEPAYEVRREVVYAEPAGKPLKADVYTPHGAGPFPGVLVVHGGAWMAGNKAHMGRVAERLAAAGYTAVAINYRLAPADRYPAQIEDCKAAIRWMRTHAAELKIDPERIGAWGYSAGGHLVTLLATTVPEDGLEGAEPGAASPSTRVRCVVAGGAPCEFRVIPADNNRLSYWLGGSRGEKPEIYALASPAKFASKDDAPCFFFHGAADTLVPIASPKLMAEKLTAVGVPATLHTIPEAGHREAASDEAAMVAAFKFLAEHLRPTAPTTTTTAK